jgi:hypothetical protein
MAQESSTEQLGTGPVEPAAQVDDLDGIEDLDELEFLLEEIESKIAPLAVEDPF